MRTPVGILHHQIRLNVRAAISIENYLFPADARL